MRWEWCLLESRCTGCGICADICPERAVTQRREMPYPGPRPGLCTGCLICVRECPFAAIEVRRETPSPTGRGPRA